MADRETLWAAQDALDRMRRAHERGTGCHLTAEMIHAFACSMIGQMWAEARPKDKDETHE